MGVGEALHPCLSSDPDNRLHNIVAICIFLHKSTGSFSSRWMLGGPIASAIDLKLAPASLTDAQMFNRSARSCSKLRPGREAATDSARFCCKSQRALEAGAAAARFSHGLKMALPLGRAETDFQRRSADNLSKPPQVLCDSEAGSYGETNFETTSVAAP